MANTRNANTFYIDTASIPLSVPNIKVMHIIFTPSSNNGTITLSDVTTGAVKLVMAGDIAHKTLEFSFRDNPIVFPNGINPTTVTNAVCTCTTIESRG